MYLMRELKIAHLHLHKRLGKAAPASCSLTGKTKFVWVETHNTKNKLNDC